MVENKEEDPYANSWVDSSFDNIDEQVAKLIYSFDLNEASIDQFIGLKDYSDFGGSAWEKKGILNFPGPFYTAETDNCGTGLMEAPKNVIFDDYCYELVMIQPRTKEELVGLSGAAAVEVFGGYYYDGNKHWSLQSIRDWWKSKDAILELLKDKELIKMNYNQDIRYTAYLGSLAEIDLRRYAYFLDNGEYPLSDDLVLPEIA